MRFLLVSTLFFSSIILFSQSWQQKGLDIIGDGADDRFGSSVSMPSSNTFAVGGYFNNGNGADAGHVKVFFWNGNNWIQKGNDIDGKAAGDRFGFSMDMPNNNIIGIGSPRNNDLGINAGQVSVFEWINNSWIQKGAAINGESLGDVAGTSISMPNATTIAVGAPFNNQHGARSGHARVYDWNGFAWVKRGNDIDGELANDNSGSSISMPDANTLAIGAPYNDANGLNSGHVRVYSWNGLSWVKKGADIDGEAANDFSGFSVKMANANTIAIGARNNNGNGGSSGHVRIYEWFNNSWTQKGNDIDGEAINDNSGFSISFPDPNFVAIGAPYNDGNGSNSGHLRMYKWDGTNWQLSYTDIDGDSTSNNSGWSVDMPDTTTIAIGAPLKAINRVSKGQVKIYRNSLITGLNEVNEFKSFSLSPNPAKRHFIFETNEINKENILQLYSLEGKVLLERTISNKREVINIEGWNAGIYFLRYQNKIEKIIISE